MQTRNVLVIAGTRPGEDEEETADLFVEKYRAVVAETDLQYFFRRHPEFCSSRMKIRLATTRQPVTHGRIDG